MIWKFDQAPNVACITCRSVIGGHPVLVVTHYEDDNSWAFGDGRPFDDATAMITAMSEVVERHPELENIADLPLGWSAARAGIGKPWTLEKDHWGSDT